MVVVSSDIQSQLVDMESLEFKLAASLFQKPLLKVSSASDDIEIPNVTPPPPEWERWLNEFLFDSNLELFSLDSELERAVQKLLSQQNSETVRSILKHLYEKIPDHVEKHLVRGDDQDRMEDVEEEPATLSFQLGKVLPDGIHGEVDSQQSEFSELLEVEIPWSQFLGLIEFVEDYYFQKNPPDNSEQETQSLFSVCTDHPDPRLVHILRVVWVRCRVMPQETIQFPEDLEKVLLYKSVFTRLLQDNQAGSSSLEKLFSSGNRFSLEQIPSLEKIYQTPPQNQNPNSDRSYLANILGRFSLSRIF